MLKTPGDPASHGMGQAREKLLETLPIAPEDGFLDEAPPQGFGKDVVVHGDGVV